MIQNNPEAGAVSVAGVVVSIMWQLQNPVLDLSTGSTPLKLYPELIRINREEGVSFSYCTSFNLDEYV